MHFCSKFGNCILNWWWVMAWTSSKWSKFWLWSSIRPWRSQSIVPQNNRDPNQGLLHFLSKFGDTSWNRWWFIAWTSSWLMHRWTHRQTQATTIPEGQNWPRVKMCHYFVMFCFTFIGNVFSLCGMIGNFISFIFNFILITANVICKMMLNKCTWCFVFVQHCSEGQK